METKIPRPSLLVRQNAEPTVDKENMPCVMVGDKKRRLNTEPVQNATIKPQARAATRLQTAQEARQPKRQTLATCTNTLGSRTRKAGSDGSEASEPAQKLDVSFEPLQSDMVNLEELLNRRVAGKSKFDYKGKSEQMTSYIRELRACIRHLDSLYGAQTLERDSLKGSLEREIAKHEESVSTLKAREALLEQDMASLQATMTELEMQLSSATASKDAMEKELAAKRQALKNMEQRMEEEKQRLGREQEQLELELAKAGAARDKLAAELSTQKDCNAKLQDYSTSLQEYNARLQRDVSEAASERSLLARDRDALSEELARVKGERDALEGRLRGVQEALAELEARKNAAAEEAARRSGDLSRALDDRAAAEQELAQLREVARKFQDLTGRSTTEACLLEEKSRGLEETVHTQTQLLENAKRKAELVTQKLELAEASLLRETELARSLAVQKVQLEEALQKSEAQRLQGEVLRRKLHNTIQELKGNIRVFCRVRPEGTNAAAGEGEVAGAGGEGPLFSFPAEGEAEGASVEIICSAQGMKEKEQRHLFTFDKVFKPDTTQATVFEEVSDLVQSALDGYKVCIFAYGQTGSGKTHTMLGGATPEMAGLVPRSLEQIFSSSQALAQQGWELNLQASMLEIYNETIRDLLLPPSQAKAAADKAYNIKRDAKGNTVVTDLTLHPVSTAAQVASLMKQAAAQRSVGQTCMNEESSRSHAVFTLQITGENKATGKVVDGVLNLIDLAGSERLSRSGATGDRLKETQAINKSLSSLGDVISALASKEAHVPFRNSKLTYLLQPCLGGQSKTLMFVNLAPSRSSANESLCSLRFAAKVNACEIGIPRRQMAMKAT
eukprot:jgi/Mesvir1/4293/Mv22247-RA.1